MLGQPGVGWKLPYHGRGTCSATVSVFCKSASNGVNDAIDLGILVMQAPACLESRHVMAMLHPWRSHFRSA